MTDNNLENFIKWWYKEVRKSVDLNQSVYETTIESPIKYMVWKTIFNQVADLYHEKYKSNIKYQEDKGRVENLIAEVTAMTLFCFREHLDEVINKYKPKL